MTQVIDFIGGEYENRTRVHGFAIRCVTTPPTRLDRITTGSSSRTLARMRFGLSRVLTGLSSPVCDKATRILATPPRR